MDAWNGYHSIQVEENSRKYLTFNTEWGRYRYRVAPQGFLGSGDHYTHTLNGIFNRKVDKAKAEKENIWACPVKKQQDPMKRCIDDTLTWAGSFENAARQIWAILYWGAESGVVFNPDKLIIGKPDVNFFGYNIDRTGIHPT